MSKAEVSKIIVDIINTKEILKDVGEHQDFFDIGASSLTIVDLQIQVEKVLNKKVDTSKLMANPTLNAWVDAYSAG